MLDVKTNMAININNNLFITIPPSFVVFLLSAVFLTYSVFLVIKFNVFVFTAVFGHFILKLGMTLHDEV